jgi:hypothetical protein
MNRRKRFSLGFATTIALALAIAAAASPQIDTEARTTASFSRLVVTPRAISFGRVIAATQYFTIENTGTVALTINSISLSATKPFSIVDAPSNGSALPPGAKGIVAVMFQPPAAGNFTANVSIATDASRGNRSASVRLSGRGSGVQLPTTTPTPTATASATPTAAQTATATPTSTAPVISSLSPGSAVVGGSDFTLDVMGLRFLPSSTINWNSNAVPTTFVSDTELTASIPGSDISAIGTQFVTVSAPENGTSPMATFLVGSSGGTGFAQLVINQPATDLVYDPFRQVIYLSIPGSAPTQGNTISVLDLASGSITSSKFAGSNPDILSMSDDGQFLYAGIDGQSSVRRFKLPDLSSDISFSLGRNQTFGPNFALDLQVAPGNPHTTAVSLGNMGVSPHAEGGVEIFDDGTPRPVQVAGFGGTGHLFDSLQWGGNAGALYASNTEDTGFDFYTMSVNQNGATLDHDYGSAFSGFNALIHFDPGTGLVYANTGEVIDPSTGNPAGNFSTKGPMAPDSTINTAFFVTTQPSPISIQSYNLTEFSLVNSITLNGLSNSNQPLRIIRWGSNGIAFNTSQGGPVVLIGGTFVH